MIQREWIQREQVRYILRVGAQARAQALGHFTGLISAARAAANNAIGEEHRRGGNFPSLSHDSTRGTFFFNVTLFSLGRANCLMFLMTQSLFRRFEAPDKSFKALPETPVEL